MTYRNVHEHTYFNVCKYNVTTLRESSSRERDQFTGLWLRNRFDTCRGDGWCRRSRRVRLSYEFYELYLKN